METVNLTEEEFKSLAKGMKAVYPQPTFLPDEWAAKVWYGLLKDIPHQILSNAIQKHMMTNPFPPTVADLRAAAADFVAKTVEPEMSELEAWALVRKAISRSSYYAEEEFAKLPPACQKAVGSVENLREWATMKMDTLESIEQSHFIRNYRVVLQREKDLAKLSPTIRERIEAANPMPATEKIESSEKTKEPFRIQQNGAAHDVHTEPTLEQVESRNRMLEEARRRLFEKE